MIQNKELNVFEASQERIAATFANFDNILVAFSGGKDSGVMLNLCIDFIRKNKLKRKIGVFHIDYEAQYQMTTDYVDEVLSSNLDILEIYRICLPFRTHCATSMFQSYWKPWEENKKDIWVRDLPINSINESNHNFNFDIDITDYEFQKKFSLWYHKKNNAKNTACLIGIRTQESLNRWRAIHSDRNYKTYNNFIWTNKVDENIYNIYPIYDWKTEDIWIANNKFKWSYNKLYDLMYQAGLTIDQMRVASPFNDWATESLKLYRIIDPDNWGKMIGRVNGVNFTGIYGGTTAMGWKSLKLPENHTWESYMYFLLKTLPKDISTNYLNKLQVSINFWKNKGGLLSNEIIEKLKKLNIKFEILESSNYDSIKKPVKMDYLDDINIIEFKEIPTYKRMCICIMKNDHLCKYMGFTQNKKEKEQRINILEKYKNL